jgi:hypothetical protein
MSAPSALESAPLLLSSLVDGHYFLCLYCGALKQFKFANEDALELASPLASSGLSVLSSYTRGDGGTLLDHLISNIFSKSVPNNFHALSFASRNLLILPEGINQALSMRPSARTD